LAELDEREKPEKIEKTRQETEDLSAEYQRRIWVAQVKFAGWLIEKIQSERDKLKDKNKALSLVGIMQRLNELRVYVLLEYLPNLQKTEGGVYILRLSETQKGSLKAILKVMVDCYEKLRSDLIELFKIEDQTVQKFPKIETNADSETTLKGLNICLGQFSGYVLSKMATIFS